MVTVVTLVAAPRALVVVGGGWGGQLLVSRVKEGQEDGRVL